MWFQPEPHHVPSCGHMWKIRSGPDRNLITKWAISARVPALCSNIKLHFLNIKFYFPTYTTYYFLLASHKVRFIAPSGENKSIFCPLQYFGKKVFFGWRGRGNYLLSLIAQCSIYFYSIKLNFKADKNF